jgi:hypothetical protein
MAGAGTRQPRLGSSIQHQRRPSKRRFRSSASGVLHGPCKSEHRFRSLRSSLGNVDPRRQVRKEVSIRPYCAER